MMLIKLAGSYPFKMKKSHKGLLHKELGIPEGEPIPIERIKKELESAEDPAFRKRLNFALIAKTRFKH